MDSGISETGLWLCVIVAVIVAAYGAMVFCVPVLERAGEALRDRWFPPIPTNAPAGFRPSYFPVEKTDMPEEQQQLGITNGAPEGEPFACFITKHGKPVRLDRTAEGGVLLTIGDRAPAELDRFQAEAMAAAFSALRTA